MSEVFDGFVAAVAAADSVRAEAIHREVENVEIRYSERDVAMRCLSAASFAWRRLIPSDHSPQPIRSADDAWDEYEFAKNIPAADQAKTIFLEAMLLGADRLGPAPGGCTGNFRHPERSPKVLTDTIEPTSDDLVRMGRLSGEVVGLGGAGGVVSSAGLVRETAEAPDS